MASESGLSYREGVTAAATRILSRPDELLGPLVERWMAVPAVRTFIILAVDGAAVLCALYLALMLRLVGDPGVWADQAYAAAPILVAARLATVVVGRVHRWSFRMSGISEAARFAFAMLAGSILFAASLHAFTPYALPRGVYVLEFFFSTSLMGAFRFGPRVAERYYCELNQKASACTRAVIVGAGHAGDLLARDLSRSHSYFVVGFVDDDPAKLGMYVSGKPVLGSIDTLPRLLQCHRVATVLLAIPRLPAERVRHLLRLCASSKASFKTIPASYAFLDERISAAMLHDLSPDDLLPRDAIAFDGDEIERLVAGRRALVTGAGGTIGGEICRQLARYRAADIVMVDMNENELYLRLRRFEQEFPEVRIHAEVADVRELSRLHRLAEQYRPEFVFHAAAHKHVPLMEDAPEEAVKNNVFGTLNVALMAHECEAERLVLISTDKAVNPTSVMGVTKRVAELVVRDLARRSRTKMTAVRFGNVLGSAGSVVPLFKQQIERGGPVTLTHPDVTRYFMTISEAVGLVLLAGLGGYGELCVLDMGKPIKVADLAYNLITMAGRVPGSEIPIVYTGLRAGEKLHEELLTEEEEQSQLVRNRIHVAQSPAPPPNLARWLRDLHELADAGEREGLLSCMQLLVPTYRRTPAQNAAVLPLARITPLATPVPSASGRAEGKRNGAARAGQDSLHTRV